MNKFDNIINNRLSQMSEKIDITAIKQMIDQINTDLKNMPSSDRGQLTQVIASLEPVGGKLQLGPITDMSGSNVNKTGTSTETTIQPGITSTTGTAQTPDQQKQQAQQQIQNTAKNTEQATADKAARASTVSAYNKETGYSGV